MRTLTKDPVIIAAATRIYEKLLKIQKTKGNAFLLKKLEEVENSNA